MKKEASLSMEYTLDSPTWLGALRLCLIYNLIGMQVNCMGKAEPKVESPGNREL